MPQENPLFIGREELLENIRNNFNNSNKKLVTQTISGMSGVGKTQTAIKYIKILVKIMIS